MAKVLLYPPKTIMAQPLFPLPPTDHDSEIAPGTSTERVIQTKAVPLKVFNEKIFMQHEILEHKDLDLSGVAVAREIARIPALHGRARDIPLVSSPPGCEKELTEFKVPAIGCRLPSFSAN